MLIPSSLHHSIVSSNKSNAEIGSYISVFDKEGKKIDKFMVQTIYYEKDRKLSSIELKRIQGLPEDYILTGTFNQKAERICRMVAPQCLEALASSIYKNIFSVL